MKYFKNTELAKLYKVSEKSVRNWIESAQEGKVELQLHEANGKSYIANTSKNSSIVESLVAKGKKYKNFRGYKNIKPQDKFYRLYNPKQIFDIMSNIDVHREIPRQYNYFDGGAAYWDGYARRLSTEETPNILNSTLRLLNTNSTYIDALLNDAKRVNVIDVGVGNALPVKNLLADLLDKGILGRYVAIDISSEMLAIAEKQIKEWFGDKVRFEGRELDITYDRFADILSQEYMKPDSKETVNLVLVLGGTLGNFRAPDDPYKVIRDSMGRNDILVQTQKLDTETTRRYFDFSIGSQPQPLAPQYKFIIDLLNIDEDYYDVEMGYDETTKARFLALRLKVALSIDFEFNGGRRTLELDKGDALLLWRYWHQNSHDLMHQLNRNGFAPLLMSLTKDQEYVLTLSKIMCD